MDFEWDEVKRAANLRKHGVDFADAVGALLDSHNRTQEDPDAAGEARFVTLGQDYLDRLLVVIWTERPGGTIRIISARKASRSERKQYED